MKSNDEYLLCLFAAGGVGPLGVLNCMIEWLYTNIKYTIAINKDNYNEFCLPHQVINNRYGSMRPLLFKRKRVEAEYADFNIRRGPLQVLLGVIVLCCSFSLHFIVIYNGVETNKTLALAEFIVSLLLLLLLLCCCMTYRLRHQIELSIAVLIALVGDIHNIYNIYNI